MLLVLALAALAQEPAEDGVETDVNEEGLYEVRVYDPHAVIEAREAVIDEMEALGWHLTDRRNGDLVFKAPRGWMGTATIHRDASMEFSAPIVLLQGGSPEAFEKARGPSAQRILAEDTMRFDEFPGLNTPSSDAAAGPAVAPQVTLGGGASKAKLQGPRDDVLVGIDAALDRYRAAIQDAAFQQQLEELWHRLGALWERGEPLEGGPIVEGLPERRRAILGWWASRADTPYGQELCEGVERWLYLVVMQSDAPITPEEAAAAELAAESTHGRKLRLFP